MALGAIASQFSNALTTAASAQTPVAVKSGNTDKAHANANDFEAAFLSSMFQHMFTDTDGDGPMGGTSGIGPWRSFLTQEFGKAMVKKGGIGIADQVYRSLISHQEAKTASAAKTQ